MWKEADLQNPESRGENGCLKHEIFGTRRWKRTAKRKPESRPPVSGRERGSEMQDTPTRRWKRCAQGIKKRTCSRTETVIQTPGLGARTGVWNIEKVERTKFRSSIVARERGSGTRVPAREGL